MKPLPLGPNRLLVLTIALVLSSLANLGALSANAHEQLKPIMVKAPKATLSLRIANDDPSSSSLCSSPKDDFQGFFVLLAPNARVSAYDVRIGFSHDLVLLNHAGSVVNVYGNIEPTTTVGGPVRFKSTQEASSAIALASGGAHKAGLTVGTRLRLPAVHASEYTLSPPCLRIVR